MTTLWIQIHVHFFVLYVTVLCELSCNPDAPDSICTHPFMYRLSLCIRNFSFTFSQFLSNLFSAETHLRYLVINVTKRVCGNSTMFKRSFSADQLCVAVLHAWKTIPPARGNLSSLQLYCKPHVLPCSWGRLNAIKFTISIANTNLTLEFCDNASQTVCDWPKIMEAPFIILPFFFNQIHTYGIKRHGQRST